MKGVGMIEINRKARYILGLVAALGLVACQERGAPENALSPVFSTSSLSAESDTVVAVFRTNPVGALSANIGPHKLSIPAGAVCNPLLAGYGASYWNLPCVPALGGVEITAKAWTLPNGHPMVSFSPDLRFAPTAEVVLFLKDKDAGLGQGLTILYCNESNACIDESINDPSLKTQVDKSGFVSRRIKHFSGYMVAMD
jgi:hypothetical protein